LRFLHTKKIPICSADGTPQYLLGISEDITERKQAEEALRESEERLRQAIRAGNIGIFDHDHHSDTIYWSPEHRRIYGLDSEEPLTLAKYLQHVHAEDRDRIMEAVRRAHDPTGDGLFDVEHRIVDREGVIHWLFTRSRTHFEGEGLARHKVRTTGAVADITERKQAAEALRRSEEQLRKMLEEREQLSQDLHDNIIQTIYAIGMSLEECRYLFHEDHREADKKLEYAVASLNRVISDVRVYIVWDKHEEISGQQFCAKLAELAVTMESAQGIHFSLDLAVEAAQRLTPLGAFHILHIVQEAMSNSLRHSKSRSGLVSLQMEGGRVRLEIRDDGVGFNLEEAVGQGHGLQNMTARAQKLGAHLQIVSKPGLGVQILVELPLED
jgi:PAS domain S-box-containing protein